MIRIILHWNKLLNNPNVKFYYDYTDKTIITYEETIKNPYLLNVMKEYVELTIKYIKDGLIVDYDISDGKILSLKRNEYE